MRALAAIVLAGAVVATSAASATGLHKNGAVAFTMGRDIAEIYESNPDGSNAVRLTAPGIDARWPALSPDGTKLAYAAKQNNDWEIFVKPVAGGDAVDVSSTPGFDGYPDWSPDGTKLAYAGEDASGVLEIMVHDFTTGATTSLTADTWLGPRDSWHPRWSPDGAWIAFTCAVVNIDVCMVKTDGSKNVVQVTYQPGWELDPTWAPDGSALLFVSYPYGFADIFEVPIVAGRADLSQMRDLTNTPTDSEIQPAWSTAGIVYREAKSNGSQQVYMMRPDGSEQHPVSPPGVFEGDPNWSHDASKLVFMSGRNARFDIAVTTSATTAAVLTRSPGYDTDPSWSPDGQRIAFSRASAKGQDVFVMGANGKQLRNLTRGRGLNWGPAWSPDGKHIAFVRFESFGAEIWEMNADGSGQHPLTTKRTWNVHPSWSPDGHRLVYQGVTTAANGNQSSNLYILDLRTKQERRLPTTPLAETPSWSPDGSLIAFGMAFAGQIWVIRPDGTGAHVLTHPNGSNDADSNPAWSPDGTQVVFTRDKQFGHDTNLYAIRRNGAGEHLLLAMDASQDLAAWQPLK